MDIPTNFLRRAAAGHLPPVEPWHGATHRIDGIGHDALEIVAIGDVINVEAIAWRDGCEAMLTLEQARDAHAALGAAIAEAERRTMAARVIKIVPGRPDGRDRRGMPAAEFGA